MHNDVVLVDMPTATMLASGECPWRVTLINQRRKELLVAEGAGFNHPVTLIYFNQGGRRTQCIPWDTFEKQAYTRLDVKGYTYHPDTRLAPEA